MLRIGLTGGIGSGKSTVAKMLAELGAALIDADDIARRCTLADGAAIAGIAAHFGQEYIGADGAMDRDRMRERVFEDPEAKTRLESIIHPLVHDEIRRQASSVISSVTVFDIPLLVESPHWRQSLDRVLVVDCTEATQISRVMRRNGWGQSEVEAVIAQQTSRRRRIACADWTLFNDGIDLSVLRDLTTRAGRRMGL